ncbi:MAG: two-component system, OmpR family, phosphate regulon sensor histidine kinase PhoR [Frankiales bacterium]|nr:two-component system, OmpR family, phosphate regulon sensor histidine kinase PhoR [Frankiales bacterium]
MAPGVPFVPLAGVQLVAIAADLGLAVVALNPRWRRRTTPLPVLACLALALSDGLTATRFGHGESDGLTWLRAAAHAGIALGVLSRAFGGNRLKRVASTTAATAGAVVVPLGAAPTPAFCAAGAALLAAGLTQRLRGVDEWWARLLCLGFIGLAVAAALEPAARDNKAAAFVLIVVRGLGSLLLLLGVARVSRTSLLAQVVGASLVGVLLMAIGAVGVGGVVASSVQQQQERSLGRIAAGQVAQVQDEVPTATSLAAVVAVCPNEPDVCFQKLGSIGVLPDDFYAVIYRDGRAPNTSPGMTASELIAVRGLPLVARALNPSLPTDRQPGGTVAAFGPGVAVIGVAAPNAPKPPYVAVYGGRLGSGFASNAKKQSQYDVTVLAGGVVSATTLSDDDVRAIAGDSHVKAIAARSAPGGRVISVPALGSRPTIAFALITAPDDVLPLGVLAVSQRAEIALQAERRAFTEVFITAVLVLLLVALVAWMLGRRLVRPVRQLTVVAARVRRGDFTARSDLGGLDEVGRLGRAMDAMTASLEQTTADLRTAAEEQQAISARLGAVLDSMTEALVVVEAGGVVGQANPAALELLGVKPDDIIGRPTNEALVLTDPTGGTVILRPGAVGEGLLGRADGTTVPVAYSSAALAGTGRTGAVVLLRDTSRDREVERMKTEFLSNVSHELRTPLTPIRGYAEILRRQRGVSEQQRDSYLGTIADSAVRMSRVVDLIVDVAAIDAGRVSWEPREVSVGAWVDERLDLWRKRAPERANDLRRRVAARLPDLLVDPVWLGKAVDELVDNALKHSPPGTPITLFAAASPTGRTARVGVKDAGPGLDPEALPELFTDFRQVDGSATRRVGGLGLGLSFVRRIADAQGMGLVVSSTPRKGAEFALDVPVVSARPRRRAAARKSAGGATGSRTSGNRRRPG